MTKLEILNKKRKEVCNEIYDIESKDEKKREKELELLIGVCVKGNYYKFSFRKILEFVYHKEWGLYLIFEEIGINDQGEAYLKITSDNPYTNKEWNNEKIPVSGWTEEISLKQYEDNKARVLNEMSSRIKLRNFLTKIK